MQKTKPRPKTVKRNLFAKLKQTLQKLSTAERVFILACITVSVLFLVHQLRVYSEHNTYKQAEKHINSFMNEAAKLAPSTSQMTGDCGYASAKYSTGDRWCELEGRIEYRAIPESVISEIMKLAEEVQESLPWNFIGDNTWNNTQYPMSEIKGYAYEYKTLSCGVKYVYATDSTDKIIVFDGNKTLKLTISCSGPALKEYY